MNHPGEIQILVEPLKHCCFLRGLSLNMNVIGDVGAEKLSEVLTSCQSLERLSLTGNHIGDVGASHLATIVKMCPQLEALSLEWNQIGDMMRVNLLQLWLQAGKVLHVKASPLPETLHFSPSPGVCDVFDSRDPEHKIV